MSDFRGPLLTAECAGEVSRQGGWRKTENLTSKVYGKDKFRKYALGKDYRVRPCTRMRASRCCTPAAAPLQATIFRLTATRPSSSVALPARAATENHH